MREMRGWRWRVYSGDCRWMYRLWCESGALGVETCKVDDTVMDARMLVEGGGFLVLFCKVDEASGVAAVKR